MGGMIVKQPNGLYCRFSSIVECPTHWNMTEEDYVEYCAEYGREDAKEILKYYIHNFSEAVKETHPVNMTIEEIIKTFNEMGYNPTEDDIKKWEEWQKVMEKNETDVLL